MAGAGAAVLDREVEATREDGKAKPERGPGFLHGAATFFSLNGLCAERNTLACWPLFE